MTGGWLCRFGYLTLPREHALGDTLLLGYDAQCKEFPITKSTGRVLHMAQKPTAKKAAATEDPRYTQALQNYEAGLRAMQEHKFEKAKPSFQKVLTGPS